MNERNASQEAMRLSFHKEKEELSKAIEAISAVNRLRSKRQKKLSKLSKSKSPPSSSSSSSTSTSTPSPTTTASPSTTPQHQQQEQQQQQISSTLSSVSVEECPPRPSSVPKQHLEVQPSHQHFEPKDLGDRNSSYSSGPYGNHDTTREESTSIRWMGRNTFEVSKHLFISSDDDAGGYDQEGRGEIRNGNELHIRWRMRKNLGRNSSVEDDLDEESVWKLDRTSEGLTVNGVLMN